MKKIIFTILVFLLMLFVFLFGIYKANSQSNCIPRMINVTVGDNTLGNSKQTFVTELGCVENVFTDVQGYLAINTPVNFKNVPYFAIQGDISPISGEGYIIGYQITKLINSTEVLYIIVFDTTKFIRLRENQFEVQAIAE